MTFAAVTERFDPLTWALRLQAKGGVNANLQAELGGDAIIETFGYPIPLEQVPGTRLPALAIWRRSERLERRTDGVQHEVRVRFDYFLDATSLQNLGAQWPVLTRAFRELVAVLRFDGHDSVEGGRELLSEAGVIELDVGDWDVSYAFAQAADGGKVYPGFIAETIVQWRPVQESQLVALRELWMKYRLPGLPEVEQPLVTDLISVPQPDEEGDDDLA